MSTERVVVRQDKSLETEIEVPDPESGKLRTIRHVRELTPYGMLLAGLGSCTGIVLHTYARNHGINLKEVELTLEYQRVFADDCRDCEGITDYREKITESIRLVGDLGEKERDKLYKVSHYCPIQKIIEGGVAVKSELAEGS